MEALHRRAGAAPRCDLAHADLICVAQAGAYRHSARAGRRFLHMASAKLSSDSIHVMLLCFGFLHTVLGASTAQIRHGAEVCVCVCVCVCV